MRRVVGLLIGVVLLLGGTAGCSVPVNGFTGVAVDARGNLLAVLSWCGKPPTGATLYHYGAGTSGKEIVDADYRAPAGQASAPAGSGELFEVRLDGNTAGWQVQPQPPVLDHATNYLVYGWNDDGSKLTLPVEFRSSEVAELRPGMVLTKEYSDKEGKDVDIVLTRDEFDRRAASLCEHGVKVRLGSSR
jgi:hypothetical protein